MAPVYSGGSRLPRLVTGAVILTLALSAPACSGQQPSYPRPKPARATPSPSFRGPVEKVSREELLKYARSLVFSADPAVGDQQRLMLGTCPDSCRYGPLVDIDAEIGAYAADVKVLERGLIIGRYVNRSPQAYDKLGIPGNQISYIWVDYVEGKWRSYVVPSDSKLPIVAKPLEFERHSEPRWAQSMARWKWRENDEQAWITCSVYGCCKIDP